MEHHEILVDWQLVCMAMIREQRWNLNLQNVLRHRSMGGCRAMREMSQTCEFSTLYPREFLARRAGLECDEDCPTLVHEFGKIANWILGAGGVW